MHLLLILLQQVLGMLHVLPQPEPVPVKVRRQGDPPAEQGPSTCSGLRLLLVRWSGTNETLQPMRQCTATPYAWLPQWPGRRKGPPGRRT